MEYKNYVCHLRSEDEGNMIQTWVLVRATCEEQAEQIGYFAKWDNLTWHNKEHERITLEESFAHFRKFDGDNYCEAKELEHYVKGNVEELITACTNFYRYNEDEALANAVRGYGSQFIRTERDARSPSVEH